VRLHATVCHARRTALLTLFRSNSSIGDSANEEMVQVADSADDNPWTADFESSDAQSGLQRADEQGKNSSDEDD
jgi:hypothetical protein